ncbi:MAG: GtrA family protein [Bacteroidales bacterium]|nr:GtrA family protein [Candidatus Scybalousia scybalohippi]
MMLKRFLKIPINLLWKIENKFIRFLFVGALNTIVGYFLFLLCIWTGMPRTLALFVSYVLGVCWNYKTTGYMVFENKSNRLILKFFGVYAVMYIINAIELHLLANSGLYEYITSLDAQYFGIIERFSLSTRKVGDAISQAIVVLPNAILTFILNQTFVFKKENKENNTINTH